MSCCPIPILCLVFVNEFHQELEHVGIMIWVSPSTHNKGMYIDGYKRPDVVDCRNMYLRKLEILELSHVPLPVCSDIFVVMFLVQ